MKRQRKTFQVTMNAEIKSSSHALRLIVPLIAEAVDRLATTREREKFAERLHDLTRKLLYRAQSAHWYAFDKYWNQKREEREKGASK